MKILLIYRFSRTLVVYCLKSEVVFSSLKNANNRLRSGTGKHDRLGHVIRNKRNVTRSLVEEFTLYLVFNNLNHGKKFMQMYLCADFNAGPSEE